MNEQKRITGKIIKVHPRGYGFITSEEIPFVKFMFHWTALNHDTKRFLELKAGMKVTFVPINLDGKDATVIEGVNEKVSGPRAIKINVEE